MYESLGLLCHMAQEQLVRMTKLMFQFQKLRITIPYTIKLPVLST